MKVRNTLIGAALVIPMVATTPAMAEENPITPDPVIIDPVEQDPSVVETIPEEPTAAEPTPQPTPSETTPAASYATPMAEPKQAKRTRALGRSSRAVGMISIRTRGTRFSPVRAVNRLKTWARQGRSGYHNGCLRLADDAYSPTGGRTSTALSQWYRAVRNGYGHRNRTAPIGAQLFWRTSNPAGHVATYVGNGKVVTNMPGGRVKKVNWSVLDRWGPYLGWAEPYYG